MLALRVVVEKEKAMDTSVLVIKSLSHAVHSSSYNFNIVNWTSLCPPTSLISIDLCKLKYRSYPLSRKGGSAISNARPDL